MVAKPRAASSRETVVFPDLGLGEYKPTSRCEKSEAMGC